MMRRGGSTQRPMREQSQNGGAPPSTIAAQIVNNAAQHEPEKKVVFGQLLQEYLNDPSTDEPSSQLNAQLISVVAEAGLDSLLQDNPFALDLLIPQALDSLAVIKLTIQRNPQLLSSLGEDPASQPPLFIWLFAKLLGLLSHPDLGPIQPQLQDLLITCLRVLYQKSDTWQNEVSLLQLYQSCVDTIITGLDAANSLSGIGGSSFKVVLPPSSCISELWPESQHHVAVSQGSQRTITSKPQAISTSFSLIEIILSAGETKGKCNARASSFDQCLPWALDSCSKLWRSFKLWTTARERDRSYDGVEAAFMQVLGTVLISFAASTLGGAASMKTAFFLSSNLSDVLSTCSTTPYSAANQSRLARLLCRVRLQLEQCWATPPNGIPRGRDLPLLIADALEPHVFRVCQNLTGFNVLHKDLQLALCLWTSPGDWPESVNTLRNSLYFDEIPLTADEQLHQQFLPLIKAFQQTNILEEERPAKRRKVGRCVGDADHKAIYKHFVSILNGSHSDPLVLGLAGLHNSIIERYQKLDEEGRCNLLAAFEKIACAGSRCIEAIEDETSLWDNLPCSLCDGSQKLDRNSIPTFWNDTGSGEDWKDVIAALLAITQIDEFETSTKPRVLMAFAIRRIFNHISDPDYLDLENCALGQWCVRNTNNTHKAPRELRIAAGQAVATFLRDDLPKEMKRKNRMNTLAFLQTLSKRDVFSEQETIIRTFGEAARVCGEEELPLILLQLVEYLGHPNAFICGVAYNELDSIAEAFQTSTGELLRPWWRAIAPAVVKDLQSCPQKAQQLSDLLGMSVNQMLLLTQTETLPLLVLTKRKEVLQRIATARGTPIEILCMLPHKNLAGILALLLSQPVTNVKKAAADAINAVAPRLEELGHDLPALVKMEPVLVACELLKMAAEDESKKAQAHRGFQALASLADTTKSGHRKHTKKDNLLSEFFESHILGIMAHFSDVLDNPQPIHPISERRRCLGAMEEMIHMATTHVSIALPQLRACLQSAMQDIGLCDQTFKIWIALLNVVDEEDGFGFLLDQTFALVTHNWTHFSEETRQKAHDAIQGLIKTHNSLLRERIGSLPSLASIPVMSKIEGEISRLKAKEEPGTVFQAFSQRCGDENSVVVRQALKELVPFLEANQQFLHDSAVSQKPSRILEGLARSLLDASVRFAEDDSDVAVLCARCLGIIGCLDPYRVESVREKREVLVLSNFEKASEVVDFTCFFLERVLVKVFHSTTNARAQGYLAWAMQQLLKFTGLSNVAQQRVRLSQNRVERDEARQKWDQFPEAVRSTLMPFTTSRYLIQANKAAPPSETYPIFSQELSHAQWLRAFCLDLLNRGKGDNVRMIFPVMSKIIKGHDLSIASFLLPFAALNVIVSSNDQEVADVGQELLTVLQAEIQPNDHTGAANIKQCSDNVFRVLDYLAYWRQEKSKVVAAARNLAMKTGRGPSEIEEMKNVTQISQVEAILQSIPAEVISKRAVECGSYARALFQWEQYIRQERAKSEKPDTAFVPVDQLQHLQFIYAQIDEPDSVEGISAHLHVLNPEQQIMEHQKAGRWTAAQSWYELSLTEKPEDPETQINLLTCLKESGQYGFHSTSTCSPDALPFAAEAAWSTGKWERLEKILALPSKQATGNSSQFNVGIGRALLALRQRKTEEFKQTIAALREAVANDLSPTSTDSIHACHDSLMKLHVLYEVEAISGISDGPSPDREMVLGYLDRRLDVLGAYISDKQYLLGIRRAAMQLSTLNFTKLDIGSAWLTSAKLARKADFSPTAYVSVLHASRLGDDASKIEYSKLLWKDGYHRKAIQNLESAIASDAFQARELPVDEPVTVTVDKQVVPNKVKSHAELLYAKWLDRAGQTKSMALRDKYAEGVMTYPKWDKGHYYLGRHYQKILESEKAMKPEQQTRTYVAGDTANLVIHNYLRSIPYGTKYYYQIIPKLLTLWLDMGMDVYNPPRGEARELTAQRANFLDLINKNIKRYTNERIPAYAWYSAFPQIITRISHPHKGVWETLQAIILKVTSFYPQQALWSLLAVTKATAADRSNRGTAVLKKLNNVQPKNSRLDLKMLILQGQKLSDALLQACEVQVEQRVTSVSLSKDLGFNLKLAPSSLVVPVEGTMTPSIPILHDSRSVRNHNPFANDAITIAAFTDDVLVLSSLQRPRKINVRGSDGRSYSLLCKPKDDLRKDQRLMEFNAMVNRALQTDIESSKRRLYIPTYGVTPLNEECGIIQWVEGLKPMRDIIIRLYRQRNIPIDYSELRNLLQEACSGGPEKLHIFTHRILNHFPPVLHEWFTEQFPDPEAWFSARLRYTRSCAVMSIVGHVLGLGDRHGENVLLEQGNGGTFHVDFNCLFDKGLTFEKPELVPFRLTHNMVDAMGPAGVEGPFRTAAELTYKQLRQQEDTLITVLETFVHDPTADFLGGKRRRKQIPGVPETPQEVLDFVRGKLAGLLRGESVPLSVEGYVESLIQSARDPRNLASMYIGWCAFF
ncbi:hypothetical protein GQ43DRAFT_427658 [Delitschia confertaspora ATCC 74209]|uniref:Serine/threonine-protein kinase MEC1 n=1 Tax=Delitschia confertaspora ATCC 74209 TaxID=1513339 RepID=A0A9P4JVN6_9PLEO|nr:hypothetical protein GQ43DRAFT_427658 [Delitschia confertaspora ATCC 74209]